MDHALSTYTDPENRPRITVSAKQTETPTQNYGIMSPAPVPNPGAEYTDPLLPSTKYDDTPTPQQRARDGSIYNNLKQQEQQQEQDLNNFTPPQGTIEGEHPSAIPITHYPQATLDLSSIPRSGTPEEKGLFDKPMNEPFKDKTEK